MPPDTFSSRPAISTPGARNARTGFFEPEDFAAVLAELPTDLRPVMTFPYLTGWRVPSEVLCLTWDRVDFCAGVMRLDPDITKTGAGRTFPFDALPELVALLHSQREVTTAMERLKGRIIPSVFHRNGKPIRSYYGAWRSACARAAKGRAVGDLAIVARPHLLGRIAHDFRRTAVRNLVRAGVPESIAMGLTGHKTRAIFDRYDITDEADLRAGASKLAAHLGYKSEAPKGTTGGQSSLRVVSGAE